MQIDISTLPTVKIQGYTTTDINNARVLVVGIPYYPTALTAKPILPPIDLLRITREYIEENSLTTSKSYSEISSIDLGDIISLDLDSAEVDLSRVISIARKLNRKLLFLGGEHLYTYLTIRQTKPNKVLIFDAHLDYRESIRFKELTHATYLRRLTQEMNSTTFYICCPRSYSKEEIDEVERADNIKVVRMDDIWSIKAEYISIDLDIIDPSDFSLVTYPEPLGLKFVDFLDVISTSIDWSHVRYVDIMEFNPYIITIKDIVLLQRLIHEILLILSSDDGANP